ncbi:LamB/YcsF family protein [Microvirga massiliensis]|uniref:LamB/YcsF family protein n=1 Tax=Microvirga massiliensis TaxID=1033741 RepID=UPI00244E7DA8|nr:LamB/YcsF family protein [Microvirga massiliensis]
MVEERALISASGKRIPAKVDTFCIHGDEPTAVPLMIAVRAALKDAGISVVPLPELLS